MPRRAHLNGTITNTLRSPLLHGAAGFVLFCVLLVAAGCGKAASVHVSAYDVTPGGVGGCPSLVDALPSHVADQEQLPTTGSPYAAAWGGIVLRCGVTPPEGLSKTSACSVTNGVAWYAPEDQVNDATGDLVITTIKRQPMISVTIPGTLRPPVAAEVDLAKVIKKFTRSTGGCS